MTQTRKGTKKIYQAVPPKCFKNNNACVKSNI